MICPALLDIIVQPLNHTVGYCLGVVLKIFIEIVQIVLVGHEAHLSIMLVISVSLMTA